MIRRLRMLLPPAEYLLMFVGVYALIGLPQLLDSWFHGNRPPETFHRSQQVVLGFAVVIYGVYRVLAFHPFYRAGYRNWLMTTPWTSRKPLPFGPIHLVWEDAVILTAACLPAWAQGAVHPLGSLSLLLGAYLVVLAQAFWTTGAWAAGYAVLFGVGLALRLCRESPTTYATVLMATYLVAAVGLRRSLRRWPDWGYWQEALNPQLQAGGAASGRLGWPFDRLGPRFTHGNLGVRAIDGILMGLLAGWALYAADSLFDDARGRPPVAAMVLGYLVALAPGFRLSAYTTGYSAPISLGGRIRTFRWIIPSYDQVFVTPLMAVLAGILGFVAPWSLGWPPTLAAPAAVTLSIWALLLGGPPRRRWWLTARHRIVPAVKAAGGYVEVG